MEAQEFLVVILLLGALVGTGAAFGTIAFFKLERYRRALVELAQRLAALEAGAPAPLETPAPAPVSIAPPPPPKPAPEPALTPAPKLPAPAALPAPAVALAPAARAPSLRAPETPAPVKPALLRPEAYRRPPGTVAPIFPTAPAPEPKPEPAPAAVSAPVDAVPTPAPAPTPMAWPTIREEVVWWIGGGLITIGIIWSLIAAYQGHYFNRQSQLIVGFLIGGGMIAGAEAMRRRNALQPPADWQTLHTPKILAAIGTLCAYGISYVGLTRLELLPPGAAIGLMGACALGGLALSLWHGRLLAFEGVLLGFAAPRLVSAVLAAPPALFAYLFAIAAAAFALSRHKDWRALASVSAAFAVAWGGAWSLLYLLPSGMGAASAYAVALTALGVSFGWGYLKQPPDLAALARGRAHLAPQAWVAIATVIGAVTLLLVLALRAEGAGAPAVVGLLMATAMLALAAAFREGFTPAPLFAAGAALIALALWPAILDGVGARAFAGSAGGLGFAASIGGWLMMARNSAPAPGAALAALTPTATLLIAYLQLGGAIAEPYGWGGVALVLAAFNGVALDRISNAAGGASRAPGAAAAFTAAAAACAVMAGAFAFDNVRMAAGIAVVLAALAWLDRRLNIPALRLAGGAFAAVTVALLSPIALMRAEISPAPLLNLIAPVFIVAILGTWAGARLFALGPAGYAGRVTVFVRIALVVLVLAFGFAEIRHLTNHGVIAARYTSLLEMGAHTAFLMLVACALAWRYGKQDRPLLHWTEMFAFVAATAHMAIAGFAILAPWWGTEPAAAPGRPLANTLLLAYAVPAALFALYAWLRAQIRPSIRAHIAGGAALVTALVWLLLEVRRTFHPDTMAIALVRPDEQAAYSLAMVAASAALVLIALRLGTGPGAMVLRAAAAALTAAGALKALAFDIGLIDGPVRFAAYALVAAFGIAALIGYQRYVFPAPPGRDARTAGGNLLPPRP